MNPLEITISIDSVLNYQPILWPNSIFKKYLYADYLALNGIAQSENADLTHPSPSTISESY